MSAARAVKQRAEDKTRERAETMQMVFEAYKACHDLEVCLLTCHVFDPVEQEAIRNDSFFAMRLAVEDAEYKSLLTSRIESLASSADKDAVRFQAIKMLAMAHYPEKYREKVELDANVSYVVKPREATDSIGCKARATQQVVTVGKPNPKRQSARAALGKSNGTAITVGKQKAND